MTRPERRRGRISLDEERVARSAVASVDRHDQSVGRKAVDYPKVHAFEIVQECSIAKNAVALTDGAVPVDGMLAPLCLKSR